MGRICGTFKSSHKLNKCGRFCEQQNRVLCPMNLVISFMSSLKTPEILLVFRSHNIGIDKFIKIKLDNKLKKFYLKGIVYQRGFHLVLYIVGKDHTVWFHDELGKHYIYEKRLEEFSSFDLQSCNRHTGSSLNIHKK